jgi:hypothetical protein
MFWPVLKDAPFTTPKSFTLFAPGTPEAQHGRVDARKVM